MRHAQSGRAGGCVAQNRFIVGGASMRSRQAQIAGSLGYKTWASGAKPNA
jgi:hypothetical protein